MNITIRALRPGEWQILKTMRLKALQAHPGVYGAHYADALKRSGEEWQAMIEKPARCTFGLFDDEILIGITAVITSDEHPGGTTGMMVMSYIEPAWRGRGLSAMLYKARIDWALAYPPFKKLVIGHRADNEASKRAMLAHGFKFTGKVFQTWPDGREEWGYDYELDLEELRAARRNSMQPGIKVRALTPVDWEIFKFIRLKALKTHPEFYTTSYEQGLQRSDAEWQHLLDGTKGQIFGLFDDKKIIGLTAVLSYPHDPEGTASNMMSYIEPAWRGRGLSKLFFKARLEWAIKNPQWKNLVVTCRANNEPSKHAILAHGFKLVDQYKKTWPDGAEDWEYKYELDLEELRKKSKL